MFFKKGKDIVNFIKLHLDAVENCINRYVTFISGISAISENEAIKETKEIEDFESQADIIRHDIIRKLFEGGLLTESRTTIMTLIRGVDDIADAIEDIARDIVYQNIKFDDETIKAFNEINIMTQNQYKKLRAAIEAFLTHYVIEEQYEIIREIEKIESDIDDIEMILVRNVFRTNIELAKKNQFNNIIKQICNLSNIIEDISDHLEIAIMKRKV